MFRRNLETTTKILVEKLNTVLGIRKETERL